MADPFAGREDTCSGERPVRPRSGAEQRPGGRQCAIAHGPDTPAPAQVAADANRPYARKALLIGRNGVIGRYVPAGRAFGLEHEHPDGR